MAIGAGGYFIVIVGLKLIAQDFGGVRWVPSVAYSVTMLGMGVGGIYIVRWSERVGVALPALISIAMIIIGALIASITTNRLVFLLSHGVLIGLLGNATLFSPLLANVARWFDRRRGLAIAVVTSSTSLAGIVWPEIFRFLIERNGWQKTYQLYALFALVTMVPLSFLLRPKAPIIRDTDTHDQHTSNANVLGLKEKLALVLLSLAILGCCVAMATPIVHIVSYTTDLGYQLSTATAILTVLLGFSFVGRIAWGAVGDKIGGLRLLLMSSASQAITLSLYLNVDSLIGLYIVSGFFGIAFGGTIPSYTLIISEHFPSRSTGRCIAIVYFFGALGMAIGGWMGGLVYDLSGSYHGAFIISLIFNFTNLLIVGSLIRQQKKLGLKELSIRRLLS